MSENKRYCPNCGRKVNTNNKNPETCPECDKPMLIVTPEQQEKLDMLDK